MKTGSITKSSPKLLKRCKGESTSRKKSLPKFIGSFGKKDGNTRGALVYLERCLQEVSKRFGLPVEYIVVSPRSDDCGLSLKALREKAAKIVFNRGIIGGSMIFHGFRYANGKEALRKSVHFGWR